jgi:hypothetical protein
VNDFESAVCSNSKIDKIIFQQSFRRNRRCIRRNTGQLARIGHSMSHFLESLITHLAVMEKVISARVRFRATLLSTLCTSTSYLPPPRRAGRSRKLDNDEINLSLTPPFSPFTARLVDGWKRAQEKKTSQQKCNRFSTIFPSGGMEH